MKLLVNFLSSKASQRVKTSKNAQCCFSDFYFAIFLEGLAHPRSQNRICQLIKGEIRLELILLQITEVSGQLSTCDFRSQLQNEDDREAAPAWTRPGDTATRFLPSFLPQKLEERSFRQSKANRRGERKL